MSVFGLYFRISRRDIADRGWGEAPYWFVEASEATLRKTAEYSMGGAASTFIGAVKTAIALHGQAGKLEAGSHYFYRETTTSSGVMGHFFVPLRKF